jgi:hypothetical protein
MSETKPLKYYTLFNIMCIQDIIYCSNLVLAICRERGKNGSGENIKIYIKDFSLLICQFTVTEKQMSWLVKPWKSHFSLTKYQFLNNTTKKIGTMLK